MLIYEVFGTPVFEKQFKRLCKKYPLLNADLNNLIIQLKQGDFPGNLVPGTAGARKVRLPNRDSSKGKSGGFRLLYYLITDDQEIYLLALYSKSEDENYSDAKITDILKQNGFL
jgi:mRNA-degrading endonuclease RelE of RelBE toxin-antitoxin system